MEGKERVAERPRRLRRFVRLVALLSVLVAIAVGSLPTVLGTSPVRRLMTRAVNARLAPGRLDVGGSSFSWSRGIVLNDVVLVDPNGKTVVTADAVRTERGLLGLIASRPDLGVVLVEGATVDVERREDGSIDVLDAIRGLTERFGGPPSPSAPEAGPGPGPSVTVRVQGGRARIADPSLAEPITASGFDASATIAPGKPVEVVVTLKDEDRSLELRAQHGPGAGPDGSTDEALTLVGKDWPLALRQPGVEVRGRFEGTLQADRKGGLWSTRGDAVLRGFEAQGRALRGDRLALESVSAGYDVERTASGWSFRKLDLKSPIAELSASGSLPIGAGTTASLSGHVDLASASKLLPNAIPLRRGIAIDKGRARVKAEATVRDGVERFDVSADVSDLAATEGGRPLSLQKPASFSAVVVRSERRVSVESFGVKAAGLDVTAKGDMERGLTLSGSVDLAAIQAQARELMDLGALDLAGKGRVAADYRPDGASFKARFAAELDGLKVSGLTAEPIERDRVRVDGASDGPRGEDGLPAGWSVVKVGVKAGATTANLSTRNAEGLFTFVLDGTTPITIPAPGAATARVAFRRSGDVFELDDVQLTATPADPRASAAALGVHAKGRLDLAAGQLVLTPVGPQPSAGLAIGPQGCLLGGIGKSDAPMTVDGVLLGELSALDLALEYWMQSPRRGLAGAWSGRATAARQPDGRLDFNGWVSSPNLTATTPRGPVSLTLDGSYATAGDQLVLKSFDLSTLYGRLSGSGTIAEARSRRLADVSGTLEPRWEAVDALVAGAVEPHAQVRATMRPFRLRGSFAGGSTSQMLKGMEGEIAADLASARAFGLQVGPTPIVLRLGGGRAVFDPIGATINEGTLAIIADLYVDDPNALWLRFGKGTKVENAEINEAVSNDVLSYIAPVLSKASNVSGRASLTVDGAAIPLIGDGALRVDGQLVFQDVVFQPGPFASEVVALTGRNVPRMSLEQPIQLNIADGRVNQSGLSIPLAGDMKASLAGSVGFDKTLALRASVPVTASMLGGNAAAARYVEGTNITVPIGGTISHPTIDRNGLRAALRNAARSMVKRGVRNEAERLLDQVLPPGAREANADGEAVGRDALKALEGVGRDLLRPRRR